MIVGLAALALLGAASLVVYTFFKVLDLLDGRRYK